MTTTSKRRSLTPRQRDIYEFVRDRIVNRGYGPTVREIGTHFGIRSPNGVMCHLKALEKKGLILRESNMSRAIKLASSSPRQQSLPFLGTAVSGSPMRTSVSSEERVEFSDLLNGDDRATLKVEGNAFSSLGVMDGDFLIISRTAQGEADSLVVALDDRHHLAICRISKDGGGLVPAIAGAFDTPKRKVLGVLVGVVRKTEDLPEGHHETNGVL